MTSWKRLRGNRRGAAAMEFALTMPILAVLMFAAVDFGNVMYARIRLSASVAAGASYVVSRASDVSTESAADLATSTANVVGNAGGSDWAKARVIVNNGPQADKATGSATLTSNPAVATSNGLCYCPTSSTSFGAATSCGTICPSGGVAGRWVRISAQRRIYRVFSTYGLVNDGAYMTMATLVQTG